MTTDTPAVEALRAAFAAGVRFGAVDAWHSMMLSDRLDGIKSTTPDDMGDLWARCALERARRGVNQYGAHAPDETRALAALLPPSPGAGAKAGR